MMDSEYVPFIYFIPIQDQSCLGSIYFDSSFMEHFVEYVDLLFSI